jgi:HlyD family secretion protein
MSDEKTNKNYSQVELRSEEIEDILGVPPKRIVRWGMTIIFLIVVGLFAGSWFFEYPDIISAPVEVTSENPPAYIAARVDGKIETLFVKDKEKVTVDQHLLLIENPADYMDVFALKCQMDTTDLELDSTNSQSFSPELLKKDYNLGSLQEYYAGYLISMEDFRYFLEIDYSNKKIKSLQEELQRYNEYYNRVLRQVKIREEDLELTGKDYKRSTDLYDSNVISQVDLERSKSDYLKKELSYEEARTDLANTLILISGIEQEILDLQLQREMEEKELFLEIKDAYQTLRSQIEMWEQIFILRAPVDGEVSFTKYWKEHQNVTSGEKVMAVVPEKTAKIIGKLTLSTNRAGKVKTGQVVNIKFKSYPYMEFGMVRGTIEKISLIPSQEEYYLVDVSFPDGLKTNYGFDLTLSQKLTGHAEIITEEIPLLVRIIRPIKSLIKNKSFRPVPEYN